MLRYALPLLAATTLAAPVAAAEIQVASSGPVVELTLFEQIEVEPDMATVSTGVTSEAPTAVEAMRRNAAEMDRLVAQIRALGIADRDIQTQRINLNPRYDYQRNSQPRFIGYQASNQVTVKIRDVERVGAILDAMVSAGATNINGPHFSLQDDTEVKAEARRRALASGQRQAEEYARAAGYSGVRLLQVAEAIRNTGQMSHDQAIVVTGARLESAAPPPPVAPGTVASGVAIAVTYEMTR